MLTALARLVVGIYVGALLVGPGPFGFASLPFRTRSIAFATTLMVVLLIIPWMAAGFIAGRRIGALAGLLGLFLLQWQPVSVLRTLGFPPSDVLSILIYLLAILIGAVLVAGSGWLGGWLSSRLEVGKALNGWRHWRIAGLVVLLLAAYTYTIGPGVALNTLRARFGTPKPVRSGATIKAKAYAAGVYAGVDGITANRWGFPDTYYTDPTGLVFLYKINLD
ncbi:MAG TPA: hypothetical protein VMX94_06280 [Armatimonadota bacterium]|nr:hypothetical protein [Armatimonadota bacterium]